MRVANFYVKAGLFILLLLFCVLFGVSLARSGMESIQGPISATSAQVQEAAGKAKDKAASLVSASSTPTAKGSVKSKEANSKEAAKGSAAKEKAEEAARPVADHDNSLNHVGNKLGDLLQIAAHHGIKLFVSLFDSVLGKG
ncbi:DUF3679 domain-containing protein [Paenibacillus hexagrammi]|uniref:DUF3679 domain-containing protein n=1 Tax=Paenibacillus hexagrammi TaxID=2908839 RepID=A0ABY3SMD2_9BACL|nr:DUF3679 domain-containing protein [Paenibacillus sp. YPD9-1]UJF35043.1 DUF3679 domain-containing protein [Paenibacillus sp. YPD9-1]